MDKFGVFNLLNSFLNFSNSNKENFNSAPDKDNADGVKNILSTITDILNKNAGKNNAPSTPTPQKMATTNTPPIPLQSKMLSTMNSHDDFIKRVKEKNKSL